MHLPVHSRRKIEQGYSKTRITDLPDVSSPASKNILLPFFGNLWLYPPVPLPHMEGRLANRRKRWKGMRWTPEISPGVRCPRGRAKTRGP